MTAEKLRWLLATELSKAAADGQLSRLLEKLSPFEEVTSDSSRPPLDCASSSKGILSGHAEYDFMHLLLLF